LIVAFRWDELVLNYWVDFLCLLALFVILIVFFNKFFSLIFNLFLGPRTINIVTESLVFGSCGEGKIFVKNIRLFLWYFDYQKYVVWVGVDFQKCIQSTHCLLFILLYMTLWGRCIASWPSGYDDCSALC